MLNTSSMDKIIPNKPNKSIVLLGRIAISPKYDINVGVEYNTRIKANNQPINTPIREYNIASIKIGLLIKPADAPISFNVSISSRLVVILIPIITIKTKSDIINKIQDKSI